MQMDEEVGKLASATPVMICESFPCCNRHGRCLTDYVTMLAAKSLECFLQLLVDSTVQEASSRGSRKVTIQHLKSTITTTPTLDFLLPIAGNIPDGPMPTASSSAAAGPSTVRTPRRRDGDVKPSNTDGTGRSGRKRKVKKDEDFDYGQAEGEGDEYGGRGVKEEEEYDGMSRNAAGTNEGGLPQIGTWKKDMEGGGGTGEGGRGMFDDYEEDDDDY